MSSRSTPPPTYRVFMLGFVPGLRLSWASSTNASRRRGTRRRACACRAARWASPACRPASIPSETPGGWQLVGRTPLKPFDPGRAEPFLMKAGDAVRFDPIDRAEFDRLQGAAESAG